VIKLKLSSIQLYEDTKRKLGNRKIHPRESYDSVLKRILENEKIPSIEEMFRQGDKIKQSKKYTTKDVIVISHGMRGK
jgi:hypothetical protein|tara:strand:- start:2689 stop:2922 length:234 start_codon:yes stop_codon:yes gene_type:complete